MLVQPNSSNRVVHDLVLSFQPSFSAKLHNKHAMQPQGTATALRIYCVWRSLPHGYRHDFTISPFRSLQQDKPLQVIASPTAGKRQKACVTENP
jgi:hypothetical protein